MTELLTPAGVAAVILQKGGGQADETTHAQCTRLIETLLYTRSSIARVEQFHKVFGQPVEREPVEWDPSITLEMIGQKVAAEADFLKMWFVKTAEVGDQKSSNIFLRAHLHTEETAELLTSLGQSDKEGTLDALVDIQYVLDGTFLSMGMGGVKEEAFRRVHAANMRKTVPKDPGERISKPGGWRAPELGDLVR